MLSAQLSGVFAGVAVLAFFNGLKQLSKRTSFKLDRFKAQSYKIEDDTEFIKKEKELRELEKLYKIDKSKKILLFIIWAVTCGAVGYSISGQFHISLISSLFGLTVPAAFEKWHSEGRKNSWKNSLSKRQNKWQW